MAGHIHVVPYPKHPVPTQSFISVELARQWIRENVKECTEMYIRVLPEADSKYYPDLKSTNIIDHDGVVTIEHEYSYRRLHVYTGLQLNMNYNSPFKKAYSKLIGTGIGTQLDMAELNALTPNFMYLRTSYTIIRSTNFKPVILPYGRLGKFIENPTSPAQTSDHGSDLWTAGPISAKTSIGIPRGIDLCWDGSRHYTGGFDAQFLPEIYENGIVLHITPCERIIPGGNNYNHRYVTIMLIKK